MKHKRYDLTNWHRWGTGSARTQRVAGGVMGDFQAQTVNKPLVVTFRGRERRVFDAGFRWIQFLPEGERHALVVQLNERSVPQQLYVDICEDSGVDPDGVPFVNDLYLDVIAVCDVLPGGSWHVTETEIIDQNDLDDALAEGKVTQGQFDLAWREAKIVKASLGGQTFAPVNIIRDYVSSAP